MPAPPQKHRNRLKGKLGPMLDDATARSHGTAIADVCDKIRAASRSISAPTDAPADRDDAFNDAALRVISEALTTPELTSDDVEMLREIAVELGDDTVTAHTRDAEGAPSLQQEVLSAAESEHWRLGRLEHDALLAIAAANPPAEKTGGGSEDAASRIPGLRKLISFSNAASYLRRIGSTALIRRVFFSGDLSSEVRVANPTGVMMNDLATTGLFTVGAAPGTLRLDDGCRRMFEALVSGSSSLSEGDKLFSSVAIEARCASWCAHSRQWVLGGSASYREPTANGYREAVLPVVSVCGKMEGCVGAISNFVALGLLMPGPLGVQVVGEKPWRPNDPDAGPLQHCELRSSFTFYSTHLGGSGMAEAENVHSGPVTPWSFPVLPKGGHLLHDFVGDWLPSFVRDDALWKDRLRLTKVVPLPTFGVANRSRDIKFNAEFLPLSWGSACRRSEFMAHANSLFGTAPAPRIRFAWPDHVWVRNALGEVAVQAAINEGWLERSGAPYDDLLLMGPASSPRRLDRSIRLMMESNKNHGEDGCDPSRVFFSATAQPATWACLQGTDGEILASSVTTSHEIAEVMTRIDPERSDASRSREAYRSAEEVVPLWRHLLRRVPEKDATTASVSAVRAVLAVMRKPQAPSLAYTYRASSCDADDDVAMVSDDEADTPMDAFDASPVASAPADAMAKVLEKHRGLLPAALSHIVTVDKRTATVTPLGGCITAAALDPAPLPWLRVRFRKLGALVRPLAMVVPTPCSSDADNDTDATDDVETGSNAGSKDEASSLPTSDGDDEAGAADRSREFDGDVSSCGVTLRHGGPLASAFSNRLDHHRPVATTIPAVLDLIRACVLVPEVATILHPRTCGLVQRDLWGTPKRRVEAVLLSMDMAPDAEELARPRDDWPCWSHDKAAVFRRFVATYDATEDAGADRAQAKAVFDAGVAAAAFAGPGALVEALPKGRLRRRCHTACAPSAGMRTLLTVADARHFHDVAAGDALLPDALLPVSPQAVACWCRAEDPYWEFDVDSASGYAAGLARYHHLWRYDWAVGGGDAYSASCGMVARLAAQGFLLRLPERKPPRDGPRMAHDGRLAFEQPTYCIPPLRPGFEFGADPRCFTDAAVAAVLFCLLREERTAVAAGQLGGGRAAMLPPGRTRAQIGTELARFIAAKKQRAEATDLVIAVLVEGEVGGGKRAYRFPLPTDGTCEAPPGAPRVACELLRATADVAVTVELPPPPPAAAAPGGPKLTEAGKGSPKERNHKGGVIEQPTPTQGDVVATTVSAEAARVPERTPAAASAVPRAPPKPKKLKAGHRPTQAFGAWVVLGAIRAERARSLSSSAPWRGLPKSQAGAALSAAGFDTKALRAEALKAAMAPGDDGGGEGAGVAAAASGPGDLLVEAAVDSQLVMVAAVSMRKVATAAAAAGSSAATTASAAKGGPPAVVADNAAPAAEPVHADPAGFPFVPPPLPSAASASSASGVGSPPLPDAAPSRRAGAGGRLKPLVLQTADNFIDPSLDPEPVDFWGMDDEAEAAAADGTDVLA